MLAAERHATIVKVLEKNGQASVEQLSERLATSSATIRRDLELLEKAGLLQRVHGGAVLTQTPVPSLDYTVADEALAREVVRQLNPGDAVIFEGQRMMPLVAKILGASPIRLIAVTNQLSTASALIAKPGIEVIFLGGKLHPSGYTLPQPLGASDLKFLVANKAFVEVEGVHPKAGITTTSADDAHFKHDLLHHALQKTIVAPFARWGLLFAHRIALASEVDSWITSRIPDDLRDEVATLPCEVIESAL